MIFQLEMSLSFLSLETSPNCVYILECANLIVTGWRLSFCTSHEHGLPFLT